MKTKFWIVANKLWLLKASILTFVAIFVIVAFLLQDVISEKFFELGFAPPNLLNSVWPNNIQQSLKPLIVNQKLSVDKPEKLSIDPLSISNVYLEKGDLVGRTLLYFRKDETWFSGTGFIKGSTVQSNKYIGSFVKFEPVPQSIDEYIILTDPFDRSSELFRARVAYDSNMYLTDIQIEDVSALSGAATQTIKMGLAKRLTKEKVHDLIKKNDAIVAQYYPTNDSNLEEYAKDINGNPILLRILIRRFQK